MDGQETEAQRLLKEYRTIKQGSSAFFRPLVIELTGTPESGKTSVITALTRFFKRNGWRTFNPLEGAEATKLVSRTDPRYNLRTFSYVLDILLEKSYAHDYELIFLDRGIYDFYCWAKRWYHENQWPLEVCQINQQFALQPKLTSLVDLAIFATCQAEVALAREKTWALTAISGETTNIAVIEKLVQIWQECYEQLQADGRPVQMIDTTFLTPNQVGQKILEMILTAIGAKLHKPETLRMS